MEAIHGPLSLATPRLIDARQEDMQHSSLARISPPVRISTPSRAREAPLALTAMLGACLPRLDCAATWACAQQVYATTGSAECLLCVSFGVSLLEPWALVEAQLGVLHL